MQVYWSTVAPPMDVMVASYLGWKPPVKAESGKGDLGELLAMFGATGGAIN